MNYVNTMHINYVKSKIKKDIFYVLSHTKNKYQPSIYELCQKTYQPTYELCENNKLIGAILNMGVVGGHGGGAHTSDFLCTYIFLYI